MIENYMNVHQIFTHAYLTGENYKCHLNHYHKRKKKSVIIVY